MNQNLNLRKRLASLNETCCILYREELGVSPEICPAHLLYSIQGGAGGQLIIISIIGLTEGEDEWYA